MVVQLYPRPGGSGLLVDILSCGLTQRLPKVYGARLEGRVRSSG